MDSSLTITHLMKYKLVNRDMLPELREFSNNMNYKIKKSRGRKNWDKTKIKDNWLLENRLNKTEDDKLLSKMKECLNKLSEKNYDELVEELLNLNYDQPKHLSDLVELILNKAISEYKYSCMYSKVCIRFSTKYILYNNKKIKFRELLLNKCQNMFEESISIDKDNKVDPINKNDNKNNNSINNIFKQKEQILGCAIFIGELYNEGLLTKRVIHSCFMMLLMNMNLNKVYTVECICTLMRTVGKKFGNESPNDVKKLFNNFDEIKNKVSLQEEFAILDLIDLKNKEKWLKN